MSFIVFLCLWGVYRAKSRRRGVWGQSRTEWMLRCVCVFFGWDRGCGWVWGVGRHRKSGESCKKVENTYCLIFFGCGIEVISWIFQIGMYTMYMIYIIYCYIIYNIVIRIHIFLIQTNVYIIYIYDYNHMYVYAENIGSYNLCIVEKDGYHG